MCGRYALLSSVDLLVELFRLVNRPALEARYNIAPTQLAPVVRSRRGEEGIVERRIDLLRWGLVPFWAKDESIGSRMINARSETAAEKPAFRDSFARRRCLVPADAFYEWRTIGKVKHPYAIRRHDGEPYAMAGLWSRWRGGKEADGKGDADPLETFTIMTTAANEVVAPLHDRMPVIVLARDFDRWLDPDVEDADDVRDILRPLEGDDLMTYPVSRIVNKPANDEPACLERVEEPVEPETPMAGDADDADDQPLLF